MDMKLAYKFIRAVIVLVIALTITICTFVYVGLSLPVVQRHLSHLIADELSQQLGADVTVGAMTVSPFNRAMLRNVTVTLGPDGGRDTVMMVERLGAGVNLYELAVNHELVINYVEVIGLNVSLSRDSIGAPLNIQPIIERLSPTDDSMPRRQVDLSVNTIVLRDATVRYDVNNVPVPPHGVFSPSHIAVSDMSADLRLPAIGTDRQVFDIKRFKLNEASGLAITDFSGLLSLSPDGIKWSDVSLSMPHSRLDFKDCSIANPGHKPVGELLRNAYINTGIASSSYVTLADLSPLAPQLATLTDRLSLSTSISGVIDDVSKLNLELHDGTSSTRLALSASIVAPTDTLRRAINDLSINAVIPTAIAEAFLPPESKARRPLAVADYIDLNLGGRLSRERLTLDADVSTAAGDAALTAVVKGLSTASPVYTVSVDLNEIEAGKLLANNSLDIIDASISASGHIKHRRPVGEAELNIARLDWNQHLLSDIAATLSYGRDDYALHVTSGDPALKFDIDANGALERHSKSLNMASRVDFIDVGELFPDSKQSGSTLGFTSRIDIEGSELDDVTGLVAVHDIHISRSDHSDIVFNGIEVEVTADADDGSRRLTVDSDIISGEARGNIFFSTLVPQFKELAIKSLPVLLANPDHTPASSARDNDFVYEFEIHDTEQWADVVKLPISILGECRVDGSVNYPTGTMVANVDAPYIRQGNKLIESTGIYAVVTGLTNQSKFDFTTRYPTKHGPMTLTLDADAIDNHVETDLSWYIERAAKYDGRLSLSADIDRLDNGDFHSEITLNPSQLTFNDSTWTVNRATVDVYPSMVNVNGINVHRSGQYIKIDGRASLLPEDQISVDLLGVNLDYIFEALGIDKVMLGGDATGCFYASNLYSREPRLLTPGLQVKSISYNKVVLGDALVKSYWDTDARAVTLDAVINQPDGRVTTIDGAIFPLRDSLDITFNADHVNVGFMHTYMQAFAKEVSGRASGRARLWGNFKYVDMEGDIACDDVKIKIGFTNTSYATSDSVKLRQGEITLSNMTLRDDLGNMARLDGKLWHKYFKEPVFEFDVTEAHNLLVYDETPAMNPDWYGRIYGNGVAHVDGRPGVVNINVGMTTAPGSTFTFVLNDMEDAADYTFITFRNRDDLSVDLEAEEDNVPSTVKRLREMLANHDDNTESEYNIDLQMDVNSNAWINLVMDPVGGDRIRSQGYGNIRMFYQSANNDLHMYGSYTLDRGDYNFTLQDIIIKDFIIKSGSSISFTGDPFAAILNISAAYALTANLSDLDESFLQDKDLNRTTVPVNAILMVNGALQQPEISFDLEFPTLTQDTYRKVRSIVSTEDMMNRQIIYLLALSRFYTPDYMASATHGNELVSVASSTISSQLGNILGSLSDKWNIAPTFRSDRGDFSDVEVDVALSSRLLNNRLLFNGNLGYRDKSLNSTQFVGDFDIEYLLNRAGTIRLKAYNRYNDMNYYVRTAQTTQGVGISFRRNFNSFSDLIRRYRREEQRNSEPIVPTVNAESAAEPHSTPAP